MTIFKNISLLAVVFMSLVSCVNEIETAVVPSEVCEVGFSMHNDATRTAIAPDGKTTRWVVGDKLAVWAKDSEGNYAFENTQFMLRYFSTDYDKAYFTSNIATMAEGDYTYMLSYPIPDSTEGTFATYSIPSEQSGKYDGKYDIMLAEPVDEGALTSSKRVELNTVMRHQMHALKITIPEGRNLHGSRLYRLEITFPNDVVGDITFDVSDHEAEPTYSNTSNKIIVKSEEGFDEGDDIWVFVLPGTVNGDISYFARGERRRSNVATYPFSRTFQAGHVTPINMAIPELYPYYTAITISVGSNNLGEDFNYFDIYDEAGTHMGRFDRNAQNKYIIDHEGEFDANIYDNASWRVVFDSDHAIVESTINLGDVTSYIDNARSVNVPYLLYQDFSSLGDYTDEATTGSKTLDIPGWTASRTNCKSGVIQLATFYALVGRYQGRLDSEPINVIKDKAKISVTFDANNNINKKVAVPLQLGWGTDTGAISADDVSITTLIKTETLSKGASKTITYTIDDFAKGGRLAWRTNVTSGRWTTYNYLGIDNIKVQIAK